MLLGGALLAAPLARKSDAGAVDVVEVTGLLDPVVVDFISKSIDAAERRRRRRRSSSSSTAAGRGRRRRRPRGPGRRIADADVPVAIWVGPSGARAYGAAAQLVLVADVAGDGAGQSDRRLRRPDRGVRDRPRQWRATIEDFVARRWGRPRQSRKASSTSTRPSLGRLHRRTSTASRSTAPICETARTVSSDDGPRSQPTSRSASSSSTCCPG